MLASLDELDESLETAVWLNYHRLNLALLHAPKHFQNKKKLSFFQDEDTSLRGFDACGFAELSRFPALKSIQIESIQRGDMIVLLETLARQKFELESFSTVAPVTRVPRVTESHFTVRCLSSRNWDSVIPYLKFWACFHPAGLRELSIFDLNSVLLPNPLKIFPHLESLTVNVKHKHFSLRTFFNPLPPSDTLKKLHFESQVVIGDYNIYTMDNIRNNPMDLTWLERFQALEHLTLGLPLLTGFGDSLSALGKLKRLRYLELTEGTPEMADVLQEVFPEGRIVYEESGGQGKIVLRMEQGN